MGTFENRGICLVESLYFYDQFALKFGLAYYAMSYLSLSSIRINVILDIGK